VNSAYGSARIGRRLAVAVAVVVRLVGSVAAAFAQTDSGRIIGVVKDQSGALVADAT
jgi:hypothetical protein